MNHWPETLGKGSGPLEPWVEANLVLSSYQEASKRVLRLEIIEGLSSEEIGYNGMTLSTLEDQIKSHRVLIQATMKLYFVAQNVAAHREFDRGKRDEQMVTIVKLNRTIREKTRVEEELEAV
ncbi:unnamed protein product [Prunus armeniaca]